MSRAEVRDLSDVDAMLTLDPDTLDPEKHYRFCQERRENVARRTAQGYEPVLRSVHGVKMLAEYETAAATTADDLIRVGDSFLMQCDKTRFKERRNRIGKLAAERLDGSEKSFKDRARRKGVETVTGERSKGEPSK